MARLLRADGSVEERHPHGRTFSLAELKDAIGGGHIEIVMTPSGAWLVCDEDYLAKELPLNLRATLLLDRSAADYDGPADCLYPVLGDVLVCAPWEID